MRRVTAVLLAGRAFRAPNERALMRCLLAVLLCACVFRASAQDVDHVPISHPVHEFLDRLGVRGVLPLHSSSVRPLARGTVRRLLDSAEARSAQLTTVERSMVQKFLTEFSPDLGTRSTNDLVLLGSHQSLGSLVADIVSDKEKHLYAAVDSNATLIVELLGSTEYRSLHGENGRHTDATLQTIGGRFRGTIGGRLGYMLQATNGVLRGDRAFARSDPRLATNFKLNELQSSNFDFTEAYLRYSFGWAGVQFGREYTSVGVGYTDRLILSENGPALDFFSIDAQYKSFRFFFLHGSILTADGGFSGLHQEAPEGSSKYLALHRFQFSLVDALNIGASEMVVYQRLTPEYAYLNPVNFFKSSEHALRDRDNALLVFDVELFPLDGYKLYGAWLIDDISIARMGSGWWGNEFGWQAGAYVANVFGLPAVDAVVEYARLEPFVYSHRVEGNDYSHNSVSLGHRLPPNADEWMVEGRWSASPWLHLRLLGAYRRHGRNVMIGDSLARNVGGSLLQGHRSGDSESAPFLDGDKESMTRVQLRVDYEPIREVFLTGVADVRRTRDHTSGTGSTDVGLSVGVRIEY